MKKFKSLYLTVRCTAKKKKNLIVKLLHCISDPSGANKRFTFSTHLTGFDFDDTMTLPIVSAAAFYKQIVA